MKQNSNRSIAAVGFGLMLGTAAPVALAADGDGMQSFARWPHVTPAAVTTQAQPRVPDAMAARAPRAEVSADVREAREAPLSRAMADAPLSRQLNVPGNRAFGRVTSS